VPGIKIHSLIIYLYFNNYKLVSMSYSDEDLKQAVNAVFDAYDKDKSGTL